jgi:alanine racemase
MSQMRAWLEVDLNAIQSNFEIVQKVFPASERIYAVVKADAYGLGMPAVVRALRPLNAGFAVSNLREAMQLRSLAEDAPLLILSPCLAVELERAIELKCEIIASSIEEISQIDRQAQRLNQTAKVHLKVDTGMGRMGFTANRLGEASRAIKASQSITWQGLLSHLACAGSDVAFTGRQIESFCKARAYFDDQGIKFPLYHLFNSAGILGQYTCPTNAYRPGLMLYGVSPFENMSSSHQLAPVVALKTKVTLIRELSVGSTISYGATVRLERDSRVATLAIGYADGLPRSLSNSGVQVLINGKSCPILGVITMDMTLIDVSDQPECEVGDEVLIIGGSKDFENSLEFIAAKAGLIPWELMTGFANSRLTKVYNLQGVDVN